MEFLVLSIFVVLLFTAWAVARKVWFALVASGKTRAWIVAIAAFLVSFCVFAFALVAFAALTFRR